MIARGVSVRPSADRATEALRLGVLATVMAFGVACASPGAPPGGPPDKVPPQIVKVTPDSNAVNAKPRAVVVEYDEVISERPRTGQDLTAVMILSPSDGPERLAWDRSAVAIRPRKGFRPNTTYTLSILPGVSDLRGNVNLRSRRFTFSTGATVAKGGLHGAIFDWQTNKPAVNVLIEATTGTDTAFKWIARSDSSGRYNLPSLPTASFKVRALIDQNSNSKLDPREAWDSATVAVTDTLQRDFYAFPHDTIGPRVIGVDLKDSTSLRLTFDKPLANAPALQLSQVMVKRADSSVVGLRELVRAAAYDSLVRVRAERTRDSTMRADTSAAGRRAVARADSTKELARLDSIERARVAARRASRDTVVKVPPPVPTRAPLASEFVVVFDKPVAPGDFRVAVKDAVSASLVPRSSERSFTRPKPEAKKPTAEDAKKPTPPKPAPGDTLKKVPADSLKKVPGKP